MHWINKINNAIGHSTADVLEFIGITNPAVDPDGIREVARHWKTLGDALDDAHWHVGQALGGLHWEGKAADAFHTRAANVRDQCQKTAKACHDGHDQLNRFADQAHEMISEIGKLCAEILEFELAALPLSLLTGPLAEVASNLAAGERAAKIMALIARIAEAARTIDRAAEAILESLGTLGRAMKALAPIAKMAAGGALTTLGYDALADPDRLRHADTLEQDLEIGALLGIIGGGFGKGIQGMLKGLGPRMVPSLAGAGLLGELGGEGGALSRLGALMREGRAGEGALPEAAERPTAPANPELQKLKRDRRPNYRKSMRFSVFRDADRAANGEDFICPNSGKTIPCLRDTDGNALKFDERGRPVAPDDPGGFTIPKPNPHSKTGLPANYHFGHVQGSEYWRLVRIVEDHPGKWTWKQILDEYNKPSHYQVEDPSTNVGHGSEDHSPGYGHYGSMLGGTEGGDG
nr:HNH/ENDO VII family nuclease [Streptomyces sp. SID5468]